VSDSPDFAIWYHDQYPRVVSLLVVVTGDADIAEKAAVEAFTRAYARWEHLRTVQSPGGWLYSMALKIAHRKVRRRTVGRALLRRSPSGSPHVALLERATWDALHRLSWRQRTAIALRFVLDLPDAEVGRVMGVNRPKVSDLLLTARRNLTELHAGPGVAEDARHR
jgi:DNA-directed RNA polymerase specialized sigma24 family protein